MSFMSDTYYHLAITTISDRVTCTQNWTLTRVEARTLLARYITSNGLHRNAYSDSEQLFCGDAHIGHYTLTPR